MTGIVICLVIFALLLWAFTEADRGKMRYWARVNGICLHGSEPRPAAMCGECDALRGEYLAEQARRRVWREQ